MPKKLFIIAGEPSADLHGSNLIKAILAQSSDTEFAGVGGELMRSAGCKLFYDIKNISVIGFTEVIKKLPTYKKIFKGLCEKLDSEKPDAVILIDYPGFNLKFAKEAKKRNIPVIYYISPQIWAWNKGRIKTIKMLVDKMLVLFEFEKTLYSQHGIDAVFVGHPLVDVVKTTMTDVGAIHELPLQKTIALLPGSRETEVKKVLPIMLKTAEILARGVIPPHPSPSPQRGEGRGEGDTHNDQFQFILIKSPIVDKPVYDKIIRRGGPMCPPIKIVADNRYDAVAASDFALVASGTATLETAILGVPMALVYKVNFLTYLLARILIKIPYIGLVNVVAGEKIIPEFIQFGADPKKIAAECLNTLQSPAKISQIKSALLSVKEKLGAPGASSIAAQEILDFLSIGPSNRQGLKF